MVVRTPHVFVGGSTTSADHFNSLSDAIEDRAGRNGPVELEGPVRVLDGTSGDKYLAIPQGTTAQRPTTFVGIPFRYNSSTDELEWHNGNEWRTA